MRLRAARDLGWTEVPVFLADLSEQRKREWMLRDNQEYGSWEQEALAELVAEHEASGGDMRLLGFDDSDLDTLLKETGGGADGDGSDPDPDPPMDMWGIVVDCDSEQQQGELLERLAGEGFNVRALL
jgi:ParB-like chromosome segregation protein Spo0J